MLNDMTATVRQMRVLRKLGKITLTQQTRALRRLGHPDVLVMDDLRRPSSPEAAARWERLMAIRTSMESEVAAALKSQREAELQCYQIKFAPQGQRKPAEAFVTLKLTKPELTGEQFTEAWFKSKAANRIANPLVSKRDDVKD